MCLQRSFTPLTLYSAIILCTLLSACGGSGGSNSSEPMLPGGSSTDLAVREVTSVDEVVGIWSISSYFLDNGLLVNRENNPNFVKDITIDATGQVSEYQQFGSARGPCFASYENVAVITQGDEARFRYIEGSVEEPLELRFVGDELVFAYGNRTVTYEAASLSQADLDVSCVDPDGVEGRSPVQSLADLVGVWPSEAEEDSFLVIEPDGRFSSLRFNPDPRYDSEACFSVIASMTGRITYLSGNTFSFERREVVSRLQFDLRDSDGGLIIRTLNSTISYAAKSGNIEDFSRRCTTRVENIRQTAMPANSVAEIVGVWQVLEGINNEDGDDVFHAIDGQGLFYEVDYQADGDRLGEDCYEILNNYRLVSIGDGIFNEEFNGGATETIEIYFLEGELLLVRPTFFDFSVEVLAPTSFILGDFSPVCPS